MEKGKTEEKEMGRQRGGRVDRRIGGREGRRREEGKATEKRGGRTGRKKELLLLSLSFIFVFSYY